MKKKFVLIAAGAAIVVGLAGAGVAVAVSEMGDDTLSGETLERASNAALAEVGPGTVTSAERTDDGGPEYDLEVRLDNGDEIDVELDSAFQVVWTGNLDRNESTSGGTSEPSTSVAPTATAGPADDQADDQANAEAAALAAVGSGTVTEFDRSDDSDHRYEVEITLPDGRDVDVELDAAFTVTTIDDAVQ
ncbi:PepSY domain-containing protein [Cryobacterium sp. CG_9.6]|uniref:PepSY domain-containing protein n=1 Tax=Cryobacterium sp. CG_9.6 TaxID=2760710 RepID=UPI002473E4E8|nr:PepSY domain-containing protein [Cryobacterium sp. CG_9.6]MDH6237723.1 putative membrane protein YkoI [Cryobacterium sp. CG_9.6]